MPIGNRERGTYTKRVTRIMCGSEPASATLQPTDNWDGLSIYYGPSPRRRVWFWTIAVTAVLFVISSLTGMITLASLPARRRNGFVFGVFGVVFAIAIYVIWVPQ
jgi:hypothetical protein